MPPPGHVGHWEEIHIAAKSSSYVELKSADIVLNKFVKDIQLPVVKRTFDNCLEIPAQQNTNSIGHCTKLVTQRQKYLLVLGCGYSGTGALSKFFKNVLNIDLHHEWIRGKRIRRVRSKKVYASYGLVSWPATVLDFSTFPSCAIARIYHQVRHPLSVLNSHRHTKWDFQWNGMPYHAAAPSILDVKKYVPNRFSIVWDEISSDIKALLWWVSFNLLAQAQVMNQNNEFTQEAAFTYKMEDLFIDGNTTIISHMITNTEPTLNKNVNWESFRQKLIKIPKYNSHSKGIHYVLQWENVNVNGNDTSDLEQEVITIARNLCKYYNYDNC
jgi:hypothetical protein